MAIFLGEITLDTCLLTVVSVSLDVLTPPGRASFSSSQEFGPGSGEEYC